MYMALEKNIDTKINQFLENSKLRHIPDLKGGITELSRPGFSKTLVLV